MNILAEKYEVLTELGHGAHSKVYLARHRKLDVFRAVKVIKKCESDYTRYLKEANLIKNLKHQGIPIIYDIEEDRNSICIIEEYIAGKSLSNYMKDNVELTTEQICDFGIQICNILDYLHNYNKNGILHLDLKPGNIIVDLENNIKLLDYDNSININKSQKNFIGSKGYAAPEQYHRLKFGKATDIYSLGILILYMCCKGDIHSNVAETCHNQLYPIIKKCIRHNPLLRYEDTTKIRFDLQKIRDKKYQKLSNKSLIINVTGTKNGVGTTHICLCLTKYLNACGYRSLCIDNTISNCIRNDAFSGKITNNGTFKVKGAYLLPNYNEGIEYDWRDDFQIALVDNGVRCIDENADINLVVAVGKYYENEEVEFFETIHHNNTFCILNHMSGKQFYQYARQNGFTKMYRMPCVYQWWDMTGNSNEMFKELVSDCGIT